MRTRVGSALSHLSRLFGTSFKRQLSSNEAASDTPNGARLAFIGSGTMSGALIRGLIAHGHPPDAIVTSDADPAAARSLSGCLGVLQARTNVDAVKNAGLVLLAVKPHIIPPVLEEIRSALADQPKPPVVVSIASGISVGRMVEHVGPHVPVVRAMPNTPAQYGAGCSVMCHSGYFPADSKALVEHTFAAAGSFTWVDERELDKYTAFTGCGPAYFFLLAEELAKAAESCGIPSVQAKKMAAQLLVGSATLFENSGTADLAELRQKIATPGGVTEAVVGTLNASDMNSILKESMRAGIARSQQIGSQLTHPK